VLAATYNRAMDAASTSETSVNFYYGATTQKIVTFILVAVKISNITRYLTFKTEILQKLVF
jgi:hypothetical protein